jgi:hypothetical protein
LFGVKKFLRQIFSRQFLLAPNSFGVIVWYSILFGITFCNKSFIAALFGENVFFESLIFGDKSFCSNSFWCHLIV